MNGTVRKAPPAPTMLEMSPMPPPTSARPALPGSSRVGLGLRSTRMLVAATATNKPKNADSSAEDMPPTICGPASDPTMMPGARAATTGQRIARCRWCSRIDASDVKRIVAVAVATAMCTTCSGAKPCRANTNVRSGTIVMPPPSPSSPARNPTIAPSSRNAPTSAGSILLSARSARARAAQLEALRPPSFRTSAHSAGSTGVIDRRLPRCRTRMRASPG